MTTWTSKRISTSQKKVNFGDHMDVVNPQKTTDRGPRRETATHTVMHKYIRQRFKDTSAHKILDTAAASKNTIDTSAHKILDIPASKNKILEPAA